MKKNLIPIGVLLGIFIISAIIIAPRYNSLVNLDEEVNIIREVKANHYPVHSVSKQYQIGGTTLQNWVYQYETYGIDGLKESKSWKHYSEETKMNAVTDYLNHKSSQQEICRQYQISDSKVLRQWISKYTSGQSLKSTGKGSSKMTKGRQTTLKGRVEIVQYTLARDKDYHGAAEKYGVSYQQVYSWVKKYESGGTAALEDRRGKGLASKAELTTEEALRLKVSIEMNTWIWWRRRAGREF